jgi:hypothetical protein
MSPTTTAAKHQAEWVLHDARAQFRSNSKETMDYVRAHLGAEKLREGRPDLNVTVNWTWGRIPAAAQVKDSGDRVGKNLLDRDGRILWKRVPGFEGLSMEAGAGPNGIDIRSQCWYAPRDAIARMRYLRTGRRARKTHRTFFKLLYYTAYFPMIWHLERTRGWGLLHASAVEHAGRAVVLAGHGGVGKSTLSLSLISDPAFKFISDNLLLYDKERVYALPEPIRLDASSRKAISASGVEPRRSDVPLTAHSKPTFRVDPASSVGSAEIGIVILLRFTPRSLIRPLSPAETMAHLAASRDLAKEVEGYRSVSAFLSMALMDDSDMPVEPAPLSALATKSQGYILGIGEGEPVATTMARIKELCGG